MGNYNDNITFEEFINNSLKEMKEGQTVTGKIISITANGEIFVDIGYKADGIITKEVLESFYKKETVLKSVRRSAVDHIVGHISLLFELVYKESYRQAKEQGYVYKLLNFKSDVPEVNAEFDDMRKYVDEFLMEI